MKIRSAVTADAPEICSITNPLIRDSLITFTSEERTIEQVADTIAATSDCFLIAEEAGRVIGFASYGQFRHGPGYAHTKEHSIQIDPAARGQGIGTALMARLEDKARADGVHALIAAISSANPAGLAFHQRIGFEPCGHMRQVGRKAGRWLDLLLMQKLL